MLLLSKYCTVKELIYDNHENSSSQEEQSTRQARQHWQGQGMSGAKSKSLLRQSKDGVPTNALSLAYLIIWQDKQKLLHVIQP
jgi:hypothetical protein